MSAAAYQSLRISHAKIKGGGQQPSIQHEPVLGYTADAG